MLLEESYQNIDEVSHVSDVNTAVTIDIGTLWSTFLSNIQDDINKA